MPTLPVGMSDEDGRFDARKGRARSRPRRSVAPSTPTASVSMEPDNFRDFESVARVVPLGKADANDHNLNIPRYVEPKVDQEALTVSEVMNRLCASPAFDAEGRLFDIVTQEELLTADRTSVS
jgi:hypothetical protein